MRRFIANAQCMTRFCSDIFACLVTRYHRILDLRAFRHMVSKGVIPADQFINIQSEQHEMIMGHIRDETQLIEYFKEYEGSQASKIRRIYNVVMSSINSTVAGLQSSIAVAVAVALLHMVLV